MNASAWYWLKSISAVLCGAALVIAGCRTGGEVPLVTGQPGRKPPAIKWRMVDDDQNRFRMGQALVYVPDLNQVVFLGGAEVEGAYLRAFNPQTLSWSDLSEAMPGLDKRDLMRDGYAAAYDSHSKRIFLLHTGTS